MGYRELIDAILREGEEKINEIRRNAEAEVKKIRNEKEAKLADLRTGYARILHSETAAATDSMLLKAEKEAKAIRLCAEAQLSERMKRLAMYLISTLRDERYNDLFSSLLQELPLRIWEVVRVNPQDERLAKEYFPEAIITVDSNIAGGLEVIAGNGRVSVRNTLDKRLDKAWAELLPEMMEDVRVQLQATLSKTEATEGLKTS
ncbi:MAG: V-type ATP synthase subunit E [Nitrospirota bacterium]